MNRVRIAGYMVPYPPSVAEAEEEAWLLYQATVRPVLEEYRAAMAANDAAYEAFERQQDALLVPVRDRHDAVTKAAQEVYEKAVQAAIQMARQEGGS